MVRATTGQILLLCCCRGRDSRRGQYAALGLWRDVEEVEVLHRAAQPLLETVLHTRHLCARVVERASAGTGVRVWMRASALFRSLDGGGPARPQFSFVTVCVGELIERQYRINNHYLAFYLPNEHPSIRLSHSEGGRFPHGSLKHWPDL